MEEKSSENRQIRIRQRLKLKEPCNFITAELQVLEKALGKILLLITINKQQVGNPGFYKYRTLVEAIDVPDNIILNHYTFLMMNFQLLLQCLITALYGSRERTFTINIT